MKEEPQQCLVIQTLSASSSSPSSFGFISRGTFDIELKADGTTRTVGSYDNRGSFGELALMYNTPRAATIIATSPGALWCLVSAKTHFTINAACVCIRAVYRKA